MIKPCKCEHIGQDKIYGKGNRVHNQIKTKGDKKEYRCTVCKRVS